MFEFDDAWRFSSPGEVSAAAVEEIILFADRSSQCDRGWEVLEAFKSSFAASVGRTSVRSSDSGWAFTDLRDVMFEAAENAPLFIVAFLEACEDVRELGAPVASVADVNRVLREHGSGFRVDPPNIIRVSAGAEPVPVTAPSESERTNTLIQGSLQKSEILLNEGHCRQAVHEVLWLMETVATAFRGNGHALRFRRRQVLQPNREGPLQNPQGRHPGAGSRMGQAAVRLPLVANRRRHTPRNGHRGPCGHRQARRSTLLRPHPNLHSVLAGCARTDQQRGSR